MTHKTRGIVLRNIRYGETSLVVTIFTELFGVQTYMVNGVRTAKRTGNKAILYQPASLLEMEVYHNEQRSMHRIKECNWPYLFKELLSDVVKNSIALFMVELLYKMLKQPEQNNNLFYFFEDTLQTLDEASPSVAANFPLYFSLQLPQFFGFGISNIPIKLKDSENVFLDLQEGIFTGIPPEHNYYLQTEDALITSEILKVMHPDELSQIKLNQQKRRSLIMRYMEYYALYIPEFGTMKTLEVLHEVL